jgi:hypothetical protein
VVKNAGALAELQARVDSLQTDVTVLGSVLEDLQTGELTGASGPPRTPAPPAAGGDRAAGEPASVEPFYRSLLEFVVEGFAPVYCRPTSPTMRWCPRWWDHAEAIYRLEALWRSWETYRLEPRLGVASWLRDFLDPQLAALTSPTGPFAQCTDDRHSPAKGLRTEQPPEDYLADL